MGPLGLGDPRALVLDDDPDAPGRILVERVAGDDDPGDPAGIGRGVLHQVGHDPLEPALVHPQAEALDARPDLHRPDGRPLSSFVPYPRSCAPAFIRL